MICQPGRVAVGARYLIVAVSAAAQTSAPRGKPNLSGIWQTFSAATVEDPKTFSRPWKIVVPLYRRTEKNVQLIEFKCVPFSEELLYGEFRKQSSR
jgi:hypothetical protein